MSEINVWNVGNFQIKMSQCVADCGSAYLALVTLPSALFWNVYTKNSYKTWCTLLFLSNFHLFIGQLIVSWYYNVYFL